MNSFEIKLYDLFRKELNLSDDKAAAFVVAVIEVVKRKIENREAASIKQRR